VSLFDQAHGLVVFAFIFFIALPWLALISAAIVSGITHWIDPHGL
jgi:hypothetical protein